MAFRPSYSDYSSEKTYDASEFRSYVTSSLTYSDDVRRHKFDCELAAAAAAYSRGPYYSNSTNNQYARSLSFADNFHYYGSAQSNYGHDRSSVNQVLRSAYHGERVVLNPHEASHIRQGAQWLADHKHDFNEGFIKSAAGLYANVYDRNVHKVVHRRTLRY